MEQQQILDQVVPNELLNLNAEEAFRNLNNIDYGCRNYLDSEYGAIMMHLKEKLYSREMKEMRLVCRGLNSAIICLDEFREPLKLVLSSKWYKNPWKTELAIQFNHLELEKFQFHRHKITPLVWNHTTERLTHLTLKESSYECDGFSTILNSAPVLYSLTLDGVRCRDLTLLHDKPSDGPTVIAGRIREPIRKISFKNITIMEDCFLKYLSSRTGHLQEFAMENCFSKPDDYSSGFVAPEPIETRFNNFLRSMEEFINQKSLSLVKMSLKNNGNQSQLLNAIALSIFPELVEMDLEFPLSEFDPTNPQREDPQDQFPSVVAFLGSMERLTNIALTFKGPVSPETLASLISPRPLLDRLESLKINLPRSTPHATALLQYLSAFLPQLNHLQILEVNYPVDMSKPMYEVFATTLETTFCPDLRSEDMREVSLRGFLRPANMPRPPQFGEVGWFGNATLTKLELIGPWLAPKTELLDYIIINCGNLRSLTLKRCGLYDGNLLGEHHERRARGLIQNIARALRDPEDLRGVPIERVYGFYLFDHQNFRPRHRLNELPQLEYLDLSGNTMISDVPIFPIIQFYRLKTLKLADCNRITNQGLAWIGQRNPNLEIIHLENVRRHVTNVGLNDLITRCKNLKKIYTTEIIARRGPETDMTFHPNYDDIVDTSYRKKEKRMEPEEIGDEDVEQVQVA